MVSLSEKHSVEVYLCVFCKNVNSSKIHYSNLMGFFYLCLFKFTYLFEMIHVRKCVLILKIISEMSRLKSRSNMLSRQEQGVYGN